MGLFASKPAPVPGISSPAPAATSSVGKIIVVVLGIVFLVFFGLIVYNFIRASNGQSTITLFPTPASAFASADQAPNPIDGKTRTVITAADAPLSVGSDYGLQYWMFISDWDYRFGQEKHILTRVASGNDAVVNPAISLHPTDNSLNVTVSVYPTDHRAGAANPGANTTGDSFTCTVENVPLQTWFAVSVTVFQRNLDVYIDGRLVKSCVLPGVPKPAVGDIVLNDKGGFSGSICNVHSYSGMLSPADARAFYAAGTACAAPTPTRAAAPSGDDTFITLFGYTFRFSTIDKGGKELSSYTL